MIPKLETPQSIALKEQSAELRRLLSCCPFLLDLFWASWECSKDGGNVWFCLQLRWFLVCKLSQTFIEKTLPNQIIFSYFTGPTGPLRNTCPSGSFQNPCQTQESKSCFSLWSQSYIYQVLQTIQMKLILLCVWAEPAVLGSAKTALKFIYKI